MGHNYSRGYIKQKPNLQDWKHGEQLLRIVTGGWE